MGLSLSQPMPVWATILNFRHLFEWRILGKGSFDETAVRLKLKGLRLREGTAASCLRYEGSLSPAALYGAVPTPRGH